MKTGHTERIFGPDLVLQARMKTGHIIILTEFSDQIGPSSGMVPPYSRGYIPPWTKKLILELLVPHLVNVRITLTGEICQMRLSPIRQLPLDREILQGLVSLDMPLF
jgi:hypothetical protein